MGATGGNPEFLKTAGILLRNGKPYRAREKLCIYSDDSHDVVVLPQEYWKLRAIAALLLGQPEEADEFILELKDGVSTDFFHQYQEAFISFASRPSSPCRFTRPHKREKLIECNIQQVIALAEKLGVSPSEQLAEWLVKTS